MVLSLDRWVGKVAIVTGASAGIGAAIAQSLVENGIIVAGLARRPERVEELAKKLGKTKGKLHAFKCDVTNEEEVLRAFKVIENKLGPVHVLVNNAGLGHNTSLVDGETEKWRSILETNVLGLCVCTREAVKSMRKNNIDGHVFHINSVAGHKVPDFPNVNVYPPSKHAVTALTEVLRQELNRLNLKIKITSLSPGVVESEFFDAAGYSLEEFSTTGKKADSKMLKAEDIADALVYALSTPPHVQVHELIIKPINESF